MTTTRQVTTRLLLGLILALGLSVGAASSASAHDVLISSTPTDNSTLAAAPSTLTFNFDQPVQNFDPVIALIGPDGKHYETGSAQVSGSSVTESVTSGPAGAYIASYRIVSADGHPVTGEVHFTLGAGATPASGSAPTAGSGRRAPSSATSGAVISSPAAAPASPGLSAWIWIALVAAALVVVAAAVILLRRPAGERSADKDY